MGVAASYAAGDVVGSWTVLAHIGWSNGGYLVRCSCGKEHTRSAGDMKRRSRCGGCANKKKIKGELRADHPVMASYRDMLRRCYDPRHKSFKYYGGRGITVCEEWVADRSSFVRDMGGSYFDGGTLDRVDVDAAYCKENCRWATLAEQQRNKTSNIHISGERGCLAEVARRVGVSYGTLHSRVRRGTTTEADLLKPHDLRRRTA